MLQDSSNQRKEWTILIVYAGSYEKVFLGKEFTKHFFQVGKLFKY